jgi:hypothetical protein
MPDPLSAIAGILGVGAAGASAISAAQAPRSIPGSTQLRQQLKRPTTTNLLGNELLAQAAWQLGVPPSNIIEDEALRLIEDNSTAQFARNNRVALNIAKFRLQRGDLRDAQNILDSINNTNIQIATQTQKGVPVEWVIENGQVRPKTTDPRLNQLIQQEATASRIYQSRAQILEGIPALGAELAQGISREEIAGEEAEQVQLLQALLEDDRFRASEQAIMQANRLGFNPGRQLGEIDRQAQIESQRIESLTGLQRSLALLGGQQQLQLQGLQGAQAALQPTLSDPALGFASLAAQQGASANQSALQIALASTEAEAARNAGITNAFGGLSSSLFGLGSILGGGGAPAPQSSTQVQAGLTGQQSLSAAGVDPSFNMFRSLGPLL